MASQTTLQYLSPEQLTLSISATQFSFTDTSALVAQSSKSAQQLAWLVQPEAKKAAEFGLSLQQKGFNLLALGEHGTGRTTLMLNAMHEAAAKQAASHELVALHQFENLAESHVDTRGKTLFLKLPMGLAAQLKQSLEQFTRQLAKELMALAEIKTKEKVLGHVQQFLSAHLAAIKSNMPEIEVIPALRQHFNALEKDILMHLEAWQPSSANEADSHAEAFLNEAFLGRYRINVLVEQATQHAPVIYDNDPSLQSLFGGIESTSDASNTPEFLRLRAGNLLRADGGTLLLHLRDILADEQNGAQLLEKIHRFLRNGTLQIEDLSSNSSQGSSFVGAQAAIPVQVKLVVITTREDYYELLEEKPAFFSHFPIKIEFAEKVKASAEHYAAYAAFIAQKCAHYQCQHFTRDAVAALLQAMHRVEEDQTRLSTQFSHLEKLILESTVAANVRGAQLVDAQDVKAAIIHQYKRHSYIEAHMRDSIIDNELMISVQGRVVGQINGLTHIDLADASFGSPVRITANCYPGSRGVLTIDREVAMSGPTHDKGVMILQSWLNQHFAKLNPLSMTASLVFEQEYNGVDGDSASCAELFVLLSALTQLPIKQGIAVTGALNQRGEVLPVGGLNEKIEGYFRVCQQMGLNGEQGVLIPLRNMQHLMLSDEVIEAVQKGQFSVTAMHNVADGIYHLTGTTLEALSLQAQETLQHFKITLENNLPKQSK